MKIFRWQGVLVVLILTVLITVFFLFFFDSLVKKILQKTLSTALNRPVEIENLNSNLLALRFEIDNIQVADSDDPYKNLLQIQKLIFDLSSEKIAFKKYHVESVLFEKIQLNTKREKPAFVKKEKEEEKKDKTQKLKVPDFTQKLQFPSVKEILEREKLKTVEVGKRYKEELSSTIESWKKRYAELKKEKEELKNLTEKVKTLEEKIKKIKSLEDIKQIKKTVDELNKVIRQKLENIKNLKAQLKKDSQKIKQAYKELDKAYKEDIEYLKNKYSFDVEGGINLAGLLFGDTVKNYLQKGLSVYRAISPYLKKGEEKQKELEQKRYRLEGRYVKYVEYNPSPDFVIKDGKLSFVMFDSLITGKIKNFSDNQKIYKKPFEIFLISKETNVFDSFKFYSKFDRTTSTEKDSFNLSIENLKTKEIVLKDLVKFSDNYIVLDADIGILKEKFLKGKVKFSFKKTTPVVLRKDSSKDILKKLFEGIDRFYVMVDLDGTVDKPSFKIKSDLDEKLSSRFRKLVRAKVDRLNKQITQEVEKNKSMYLNEIKKYEEKFKEYEKVVSSYESSYKELLKEIKEKFDPKKLQKKIKKNILKNIGF